MLLSLNKKFLFIANLKTASTSIERVLAPHAELRLTQSQYGKHQSFVEFAERFRWLLGVAGVEDLFVFGVIRDPVDYVLSIYNSHKREQFKENQRLYTGDMDFARFITQWVPRNADQLKNQYLRFISAEGRLITNLLISYDKLDKGLELVADRLGIPELTKLPRANTSPEGAKRADLTQEQIDWIDQRFRKDKEFIDRHADRVTGA
ncbi:MAG TPA: sulfotransferase family 2 domain-containing protein [Rhizomicrobium sp.]|nr:sulfotransferase family 2 domain-containing protein [Rhizomicrobium sp.]